MRVQAAQTAPRGFRLATISPPTGVADKRAGSLVDDQTLIGDPATIGTDPVALAELAAAVENLPIVDTSRRISESAKCSADDGQDWFPSKGRHIDVKALCEGCPVRLDCLLLALRNKETSGTWGGTSAGSRRRLLRLLSTRGAATNDKSPVAAAVAGGKESA